MHPENPPNDDADHGLQDRFAALFQKFAPPPGSAALPVDADLLLDLLRTDPGGRILCCARSMIAYGWPLAARGCAVHLPADGCDKAFDGAVWSVQELGERAVGLLALELRTGARLIVTAEPPAPATLASGDAAARLAADGFRLVEEAVSPGGHRFGVWLRSAP